MTEEELLPIVTRFRRAFDESDLSEKSIGREANIRVGGFPDSACAEACTVLGCYLTNEYKVSPLVERIAKIEDGEYWGSHNWLEHNDIKIDITADQFDYIKEPVIVTKNSVFHSQNLIQIDTMTDTFDLENEEEWIVNIYNEVTKHIT